MKQLYKITLYSLVIILVISGILLFVFRDRLMEYLHGQSGITILTEATPISLLAKETLDLKILTSKRFTALTNGVLSFDFETICWRPDAVASTPTLNPAEIATGTEPATTTKETAASTNCVKGNDIPFVVKQK